MTDLNGVNLFGLETIVFNNRWFYLCFFLIGVIPAVVTSALAASGICAGDYAYCDVARFFDIFLFTIIVAEFVVDMIVSISNGYGGRSYVCVFKLLHIGVCITAYSMSPFVNLAFIAACRLRDWNFAFLGKLRDPFIEGIMRTVYMSGLYSCVLCLMMFLCALVGYNIFWNTDKYTSPFGSLEHSLVVVAVYFTGGPWLQFQSQLDKMGYTISVVFTIVCLVLGYMLFTNTYLAIVCSSTLAEAQRGVDSESTVDEETNHPNPTESKKKVGDNSPTKKISEEAMSLYVEQCRHMHTLYEELLLRMLMTTEMTPATGRLVEIKHRDTTTKPKNT